MTLSELVTDLATSQRLRDAGFPQDTAMYWQRSTMHIEHPVSIHVKGDNEMGGIEDFFEDICAAPTAEEILRALPVRTEIGERWGTLESYVSTMNDFSFYVGWQAHHSPTEKEDPWYGANKLSEAAALSYLWWKKEVAG